MIKVRNLTNSSGRRLLDSQSSAVGGHDHYFSSLYAFLIIPHIRRVMSENLSVEHSLYANFITFATVLLLLLIR